MVTAIIRYRASLNLTLGVSPASLSFLVATVRGLAVADANDMLSNTLDVKCYCTANNTKYKKLTFNGDKKIQQNRGRPAELSKPGQTARL